jgi:23S rRNA (adenine2503-C2)-methyltransferase
MKILKHWKVPTGDIYAAEGEKGVLEFLSVGDYGKDVNLSEKAVPSGVKVLPLEEKWVITISTQYGCDIGCAFCDVPKVGPGINCTTLDMQQQIITAIDQHPEVEHTKRLNIHFARMGEPSFNRSVLETARWLNKLELTRHFADTVHPVVSTMMPNNNAGLFHFIQDWMEIKNFTYKGEAGLQLSINSTNELERYRMFGGHAMTLEQIHAVIEWLRPRGRKITLNFALAGYEIDPQVLLRYFNPDHFICKLTPMHKTARAEQFGIKTEGDYCNYYAYEKTAAELRAAGYEVLVFIASPEEDDSRITCGNALLSGTEPFK